MLAFVMVSWPDLQTMLTSVMSNLSPLWVFVQAFCYLSGMFLGFRAVYSLKEYGEMRSMMSSQTSLKKPMILFVVSTVFLYLPSAYQMSLFTFFASPSASPLSWSSSNYTSWSGIVTVVLTIVQFIGLIAFVRGWFMVAALGSGHSQHATFGKSMTHIVGGIFAMNIVATIHVLESTIGVTWY